MRETLVESILEDPPTKGGRAHAHVASIKKDFGNYAFLACLSEVLPVLTLSNGRHAGPLAHIYSSLSRGTPVAILV